MKSNKEDKKNISIGNFKTNKHQLKLTLMMVGICLVACGFILLNIPLLIGTIPSLVGGLMFGYGAGMKSN